MNKSKSTGASASLQDKLKKKPGVYLLSLINPPAGASQVTLKPAKTIRLIAGEQTLQPDGIYAYRQNGRLTCVALQAEDSTGKNVSSLLGKALLSQLCNASYSLARVDEVIGTTTRAARVDRIVVVFLYDKSHTEVAKCVNGVVQCLSPVNELALNVFALPVDLTNDTAAISELQSIISLLPQI